MARREIIVYTDDVTGETSNDIQTVMILDGTGAAYAVDMSEATHRKYEEAIAPYVNAGKRIGRMPKVTEAAVKAGNVIPISGTRTVVRTDKEQNKAIREWWGRNEERGVPALVEFGRIPQAVQDAFHKHGGRAVPASVNDDVPASELLPDDALPEPAVKPAQKPRAARSSGTATAADSLAFLAPGSAQPEAAPARKRATPAAAKETGKAPRKAATSAKVASKPQTAAKRTGRRAAAS